MDVASIPFLASSLFPYGRRRRFMCRRECHPLFHMFQHASHMPERMMLRVAHHRVVLALRDLAHVVAFLNLGLCFGHFLSALIYAQSY